MSMNQIGRYEIIAELGRGAMGVVYRARDSRIGREVAMKTIRLSDKFDETEAKQLRDRLFREAQSAGRLSHPGIVTIYDIDDLLTTENLAPTGVELSNSGVYENAATGAVVDVDTAVDTNARDNLTYTLQDNEGGRFAIDEEIGREKV